MYSFRSPSTRSVFLITVTLLLIQSSTVGSFPDSHSIHTGIHLKEIQKREDPTGQEKNAQDVYGIGVRVGSYLQAFAFIIGFTSLKKIDPKSQFSGIILAFQLLIRWSTRLCAHEISNSELWVGLAQLLLFTTPGAILLFLSFSFTRRHWKTKDRKDMLRKEVIRGEGLNFLQVFTILAWVNTINLWFTINMLSDDNLVPEAKRNSHHIWMCGYSAKVVKGFMFCQSVATLTIEVVPYMVYFWAWVSYVRDFNRAGVFPSLYAYKKGYRRQNPHLDRQYDRFEQRYNLVQQRDEYKRENPNCFHSVLKNLWSGVKWGTVALIAVAAFGYAVMLGISVEFTIRAADLNPEGNALDSSQLLPLLTGIVAFISALGNALDNLLLSKTPVRFERLPHGKILVFTKDGNGLPDETLELMKARRKP